MTGFGCNTGRFHNVKPLVGFRILNIDLNNSVSHLSGHIHFIQSLSLKEKLLYNDGMTDTALTSLLKQDRACELCANNLPLGPRPMGQIAASARNMIIGQPPGLKVHRTGKPWNDPSGVRQQRRLNLSAD